MLIKLMVRHHLVVDVKMLKQHGRGARIFSEHQVDLLQQPDGSECHVFHVSHRSGYDI